jgi:hypothetical protein
MLDDLELRHLRHLMAVRTLVHVHSVQFDWELEDFVLEMREAGNTARGMAEQLGVSPSTVQHWTVAARRRRERCKKAGPGSSPGPAS